MVRDGQRFRLTAIEKALNTMIAAAAVLALGVLNIGEPDCDRSPVTTGH
jgi:hypothetical protein